VVGLEKWTSKLLSDLQQNPQIEQETHVQTSDLLPQTNNNPKGKKNIQSKI